MGGGALIVLLAVLWAVVLIPLLLARHDSAAESKQVDRFRRAMTAISRNERSADPLRLRRNRAARAAAARRRRITFGLAGVVVLAVVGAAFGYLQWLLVALPVLVLAGWLVLAFRAAMTQPAYDARPRTSRQRVSAAPRGYRYDMPVRAPWAEDEVETYDLVADEESEEYYEATGTDSGSWAPVPVPVPRNVRASGVSGDVIAHSSSWSSSVLANVRARTSRTEPTPAVAETPVATPPAPQSRPVEFFDQVSIIDDEPSTSELPIIRHAAG